MKLQPRQLFRCPNFQVLFAWCSIRSISGCSRTESVWQENFDCTQKTSFSTITNKKHRHPSPCFVSGGLAQANYFRESEHPKGCFDQLINTYNGGFSAAVRCRVMECVKADARRCLVTGGSNGGHGGANQGKNTAEIVCGPVVLRVLATACQAAQSHQRRHLLPSVTTGSFISCTSLLHSAISSRTNAANSVGELAVATRPSSANRFTASGSFMTLTIA